MIHSILIGSLLAGLVVPHCDDGFEKERIENTEDYVCKKVTASLTDQDVLNELAQLDDAAGDAVEVSNSNYLTEELFIPATPDTQINDEEDDVTTDPFLTTTTTGVPTSTSSEDVEVLQNIEVEEEGSSSSPPTFLSYTVSTDGKFPARKRALCKPGFEAHSIEGSEDYACKPKDDVEILRSSRKLAAPQQQEQMHPEFSNCMPVDWDSDCCIIQVTVSVLHGKDFFKMTCAEGWALKTFEITNDKPELTCCRLPA